MDVVTSTLEIKEARWLVADASCLKTLTLTLSLEGRGDFSCHF
jgi:hypothetical protein